MKIIVYDYYKKIEEKNNESDAGFLVTRTYMNPLTHITLTRTKTLDNDDDDDDNEH